MEKAVTPRPHCAAGYLVQTSANLSGGWLSVLTTNLPCFTFADTNIGAFTQCYYRVLAVLWP